MTTNPYLNNIGVWNNKLGIDNIADWYTLEYNLTERKGKKEVLYNTTYQRIWIRNQQTIYK